MCFSIRRFFHHIYIRLVLLNRLHVQPKTLGVYRFYTCLQVFLRLRRHILYSNLHGRHVHTPLLFAHHRQCCKMSITHRTIHHCNSQSVSVSHQDNKISISQFSYHWQTHLLIPFFRKDKRTANLPFFLPFRV